MAVIYVAMLMAVVYLVARYATIGFMHWRASRAAPPAPDHRRDQSRTGQTLAVHIRHQDLV